MKSSLTVTDLNKIIKSTLETTPLFERVSVHGELSNLTKASSGHWYFTIKDSTSRLACVMFSSAVRHLNTVIKEGDHVELVARVTFYEPGGSLQLNVSHMQLFGIGSLFAQLETLRLQLQKEGLFDTSRKKPLPRFPLRIGLITSLGSAAQADVLKTVVSRWPIAHVTSYGSLVQGEGSVNELIKALTKADNDNNDVLILARGGGSIEDLWSFNNEQLVRHIHTLKTPIISGVGHESDTTLVDYVVDVRGPTPTGAATRVTPILEEVIHLFDHLQQRIYHVFNSKLLHNKTQIHHAFTTLNRLSPTKLVEKRQFLLNEMSYRLAQSIRKPQLHYLLGQKRQALDQAVIKYTYHKSLMLTQLKQHLAAYDMMQPLQRGFAYLHQHDRFISRVADISLNQSITITMHDGQINAQVTSIKENSDEQSNI